MFRLFILFAYTLFAMLFFAVYGNDMLDEIIDLRFFSDSTVYESEYYELSSLSVLDLFFHNPNYFGPEVILRILSGDREMVLLLNIFLFFIAFYFFYKLPDINKGLLTFFVLINPITFSSLLSINKEILVLLASSLICYSIEKRRLIYFFWAQVISILVRWQFLVYFIIVFVFRFINKKFGTSFLLMNFILLITLSISGGLIILFFPTVFEIGMTGDAEWGGSGLWGILLTLQSHGLYIISAPIKIFHSIFGILFYIPNLFNPKSFYNDVVVILHSLCFLILFCYFLYIKNKIYDEQFFLIVTFCIFFGLSPIYAPRYYYFAYLILSIYVSRGEFHLRKISI